MRVKFKKGQQKKFIVLVMKKMNSTTLRDLSNRLNISYSCIKKYYNELRLFPFVLFEDLCFVCKIDKNSFQVNFLKDNWGQIKGGKFRKKNGPARS
jgi:hypothetical protein